MKNRQWNALLIVLALLLAGLLPVFRPAAAQTPAVVDPYALLDAVNVFRQSRGMYAFQVNQALMTSAQTHSAYQASIGLTTFIGTGNTNASQRASAAGYGDVAGVECGENIAFGVGLSADAIVLLWNDPQNLANLLSPLYVDIGVGAAADSSGKVFYTLDVCRVNQGQPVIGLAGTPGSTANPTSLIPLSTPQPDGSVYHIVQQGENLVLIAQEYGISLAELFALNNLTKDSSIYPDQKLQIRVANTVTPTSYFTATPTAFTPEPTSTRRPTRTPAAPPSATLPAPTPTPTPAPDGPSAETVETVFLGAIFLSLAAGVLLVGLGLVLRLRK